MKNTMEGSVLRAEAPAFTPINYVQATTAELVAGTFIPISGHAGFIANDSTQFIPE